jgi:putative redox protein
MSDINSDSVMEIVFEGGKIITALADGHVIRTDQPLDNGGENSAPSPFDLYLASVGTCTGAYVKSFCERRNIPTDKIKLVQKTDFDEISGLPLNIDIDIVLPGDFPDRYKESVRCAADLCKVKKSILKPPSFNITSSKI